MGFESIAGCKEDGVQRKPMWSEVSRVEKKVNKKLWNCFSPCMPACKTIFHSRQRKLLFSLVSILKL